jgi:hypothetical protein
MKTYGLYTNTNELVNKTEAESLEIAISTSEPLKNFLKNNC